MTSKILLLLTSLTFSLPLSACSLPNYEVEASTTIDKDVQICENMIDIINEYIFAVNWYVDVWDENTPAITKSSTELSMEIAAIGDKMKTLDLQLEETARMLAASDDLINAVSLLRKTTSNPGKFFSDFESVYPRTKEDGNLARNLIQQRCE